MNQVRSLRKNAKRALSFLSKKKWARANGSRGSAGGGGAQGRFSFEQNGISVAAPRSHKKAGWRALSKV